MKRVASMFASTLFLITPVFPAVAAEFQAEEELSITVPVAGDLYAFGARTTISENVDGDLVTAGGDITVRGSITEDLMVAGGKVRIEGNVGDDARIAGGDVSLDGTVFGDVIIAGGTLEIREGSVIEGDLIIMGGEVRMAGQVKGKLFTRTGVLRMSGTVEGATDIMGEDITIDGRLAGSSQIVAESITLGEAASFGAPVLYWSKNESIDFGDKAEQGAQFSEELRPQEHEISDGAKLGIFAGIFTAIIGYSLLSAAVMILVLLFTTKTYFSEAAKRLTAKPWQSLLTGFLYFMCMPIAGLLLLLTIIGIPLALAVFAVYTISLIFASVCSAVVLAKWAEIRWKKKWSTSVFFFVALLVFILLKVLSFIPILGWIAKAILVFMAFGALLHTKYEKYLKIR